MILIGISGKKQSGKNTVAALMATLTNQTVEEIAFADELKSELARMLMVKVSDIENNKPLYRTLLQGLGVYRRDSKNKDYWVEKAMRKVLSSTADVVVITDVRFLNEAESIRQCGGQLIRMARDTGITDTHESEIALDTYKNFHHIILNTGSLEHLRDEVQEIMTKIGIKVK